MHTLKSFGKRKPEVDAEGFVTRIFTSDTVTVESLCWWHEVHIFREEEDEGKRSVVLDGRNVFRPSLR
jgi:hypothetical protein